MGKTRDLFKEMRDTKGTFYTKTGTIKDKNGKYLTEAGEIKKGGKKTEKNCTKQLLMTQLTTVMWSLTWIRHPGV